MIGENAHIVQGFLPQEKNMERDYFDIIYSVLFPMTAGLMAIFFFGIGIRAILTKRPFLVSNRWMLSLIFVALVPGIVLSLKSFSGEIMGWTTTLLYGVILVMMWYQLKGYVAYAVTDTSFREALVAALQKLQMPYEESLSVIRLTSVNADLQVAVQSWMGTGTIKVKQRAQSSVLKQIVPVMNEYYRTSAVSTNFVSCVFLVVVGVVMAIFALKDVFFISIF